VLPLIINESSVSWAKLPVDRWLPYLSHSGVQRAGRQPVVLDQGSASKTRVVVDGLLISAGTR